MLHHVAIEVEPTHLEAHRRFWPAAGFVEIAPPAALGDGYTWFEGEGTQIHLMESARPSVPERGHVALITPDLDAAMERLRAAGFEVIPGRELWGSPRAKVTLPDGHTVELMASPPAPQAGSG